LWDVGKPVFPLGYQNVPSETFTLTPDQEHRLGSDGFSWASDSHALVFGDAIASREGALDAVLIKIDETGGSSAFTHAVPVQEVCGAPSYLTITHADFGPDLGGDRVIRLDFRSHGSCKPNSLEMHSSDFQPAKLEIFQRRHQLKSVVVPQ
jgi:hypothetical protein